MLSYGTEVKVSTEGAVQTKDKSEISSDDEGNGNDNSKYIFLEL